jgi:acetylornithine/succinyldiaminopimelate/putrescine aminotransferase
MDIVSLVKARLNETYDLHRRFINPQFVRVLEVIGFNRNYASAKGAVLTDAAGNEVLDFLAGFGVFNIGRNHPLVARVLHEMLDSNPANMVQMDVGGIAGLLAEALSSITPGDLDAVFFTNYGTLFIADEVQTGFGRTGKMFAVNHWEVVPDIMVVSKALSGGFIPVGAIITRRALHARMFDSMERCFAHSNTFGQNDLAMAAGLATLRVLEEEGLVGRAAEMGEHIRNGLEELAGRYELLQEVRGLGLMIGMQFGEPKSLTLKAGWKLLHKMNHDLFCQMITMPLLDKHNILTQVAGHGLDTVKILPPLVIDKADADRFLEAMESVLKVAHRFPGSAWSTTKDLAIRTAKSA